MKLLVIGGSYFYGRVFVMQAAGKHDITVVNRGTYSMAQLGVQEIHGDRRDGNTWKTVTGDYDVIIDFCAYEKGDIAGVLENLPGKVKQYIFISTVDVYRRGRQSREGDGTGAETEVSFKDETFPFETRVFPGEVGGYIAGKVALEQEIREECGKRGIAFTVLRPAILYGPFNYAPRESVYIRMIVQNRILPHITDAEGAFQMVYVKDAAEAVLKCLLNERTYGQAYNLCPDQKINYNDLYEALRTAAGPEPEEMVLTAGEPESHGVPLLFPVTEEETELYSNEKSRRELGMEYISLSEGMARTYRAFRGVFEAGS